MNNLERISPSHTKILTYRDLVGPGVILDNCIDTNTIDGEPEALFFYRYVHMEAIVGPEDIANKHRLNRIDALSGFLNLADRHHEILRDSGLIVPKTEWLLTTHIDPNREEDHQKNKEYDARAENIPLFHLLPPASELVAKVEYIHLDDSQQISQEEAALVAGEYAASLHDAGLRSILHDVHADNLEVMARLSGAEGRTLAVVDIEPLLLYS